MKTIARTLIILLAAGLISLGWYAYSTAESAQTSMPERPAQLATADDAADAGADTGADTADQTPPPRAEGDEHDEHGFSVSQVLGGMAGTIGQTALVIALVVLVQKLGNWVSVGYFKKRKTHSSLNAPPQSN